MQLPLHPLLELVTVTLYYNKFKFCISLFYRPPSSSLDVMYMLQNYLELINIPTFNCFVLIGDFNINFLDTSVSFFDTFYNIFGLTQVVNHPTHIHNNLYHSLIDLVFLSNLHCLSNCQVIPPLSNSDHLGIRLEMKSKHASQPHVTQRQRTIWRYTFANWAKARILIDNYNWESLFHEDIN